MSVKGLNKITERILADAKEQAEKILSDARAECRQISEDYAKKAEKLREEMTAEAQKKGEDMIARSKASAAMQKRNLVMARQSELVEEVFQNAYRSFLSDKANYVSRVAGLMSAAMLDQINTEEENRRLYKEEEPSPESYDILLNEEDLQENGKAILEAVTERLEGKVSKERLTKLKLCKTPVAIRGGAILRYGEVEANCSAEMLFEELRRDLEGEVSQLLLQRNDANQ